VDFVPSPAPASLAFTGSALPDALTFTADGPPSELETDLMAQSPYSASATSRLLSAAASVNSTLVKASNGTLKRVNGYNARASAVYLKLYNKTTAPAETDTPKLTIYLPASTAFALLFDDYFSQGIGYRLTTGSADNDTGALSSGDILGLNVSYI
jgi:hypothetical protein